MLQIFNSGLAQSIHILGDRTFSHHHLKTSTSSSQQTSYVFLLFGFVFLNEICNIYKHILKYKIKSMRDFEAMFIIDLDKLSF